MATVIRDDMVTLRKDLKKLRDEVRLKVHLASMELRSEWERLEPEAERTWHDLSATSVQAMKDMQKRLLEFRDRLRPS